MRKKPFPSFPSNPPPSGESEPGVTGKDEEKELEAEDEEESDGILNLSGDEAEWGSWNSEQADRRGKKRLATSGFVCKRARNSSSKTPSGNTFAS